MAPNEIKKIGIKVITDPNEMKEIFEHQIPLFFEHFITYNIKVFERPHIRVLNQVL